MSMLRIIMIAIMSFGLFNSMATFAGAGHEKSATVQMAEIMHRLKHYPSPLGKEVLQKIISSKTATDNQRTIATAMLNLEHKVNSRDVPKLKALIADKKTTSNDRELAKIVLNLDHRPTSHDKALLKEIMQ